MISKKYVIPGGIFLDASSKVISTGEPIASLPLPEKLWIPLRQNYGVPPKCIVKPGDRVLKFQTLAVPNDLISSPVHAPTSGIIEAVEDHPIAHASGLSDRCVLLRVDGKDEATETPIRDWENASEVEIRQWIRDAGIVGLGGAVFPADIKIHPPTETLIINGAECEPYISCDDMLMRTYAQEIIAGSRILQKASKASRVIIGIEDDKPQAVKAMQAAIDALPQPHPVTVQVVPARYPSGYAKQLIYLLTGIKIPADALPFHYGVQCFNVGTAFSVYKAILTGEPQVSRIVTVTGDVMYPRNYEVAIGTPIEYLLSFAKPKLTMTSVVMGGPMMGFPILSLSMPVVKATSCILGVSDNLFARREDEQACIRCSACATVCPVSLSPHLMANYAKAKRFDDAEKMHLFDCIECGCCSYVCPSNIPLVHYFKYAKDEIRAEKADKEAAWAAKKNVEEKQKRLAKIEQEKAERLAKRAATAAASLDANPDDQAAILEALDRVKKRRQAKDQEKKA